MKGLFSLGLCLLILTLTAFGQRIDPAVAAIDKRYAEIAEKARLAETDEEQGQFGDLFVNRLTINERKHQWRAVGIYEKTYSFYYRAVDDEKRLYPDQLVFIKVDRRESARSYAEEYLFADSGQLIFYAQRADGDADLPAERKIYFSRGKPVRFTEDRAVKPAGRGATAAAQGVMRAASELKSIFSRSLQL